VNEGSSNDESTNNPPIDGRPTQNDILAVKVHFGLSITCPQLKGVPQHGYVYTVTLRADKESVTRTGCGVGTPEVFAQAIVLDLQERNGFAPITDIPAFMEKMKFVWYSKEVQ
jgi:hypothetical protein